MNKLSIIAILAATTGLNATTNSALAQSAGGPFCGRDDGGLTCVRDGGNVDDILTLTRCDNVDTRPTCSSIDLDLDIMPRDPSFGRFNDICKADGSFPGHLEITCFGIPVLTCDDVPFVGWTCK